MEVNKTSSRLGEEAIVPLLLKLSIPSIIGMAIQALYNVVDSIYIGRLSTEALSALSLAFPIQMGLIAVAVGTGIGANSLISRLLGEDKGKRANNVAEHVVFITIFYGIIVATIGFFFSDNLIKVFTNDPILADLCQRYIRIIMIGSIAMFSSIIFNGILRGEGNTFVPMLNLILGAVINMILDPLLIFGIGFFPELGVEGAAYATDFARVVSAIFITMMILGNDNQVKIRLKDFEFDLEIVKEIYRVGFPAMVMQLVGSIMISGMNIIVAAYDTTAIAIVGIYFRLQAFVFMPVFGLNYGFMPIVGYNYGNNKPKRMKKTIIYGILIGFAFATIGFIIFQVFPKELIRLFNDNQQLIVIGSTALKRISVAFPVVGISLVGATTFQAVGKGLPSLLLSLLRQIILLLPTMYLLGKLYGLSNMWFAFPIAEGVSFILLVIWMNSTLKESFADMRENSIGEV